MDKKQLIEIAIPHSFLGFTATVFALNPNSETVMGLLVASILWMVTLVLPRVFPAEKPTKLEAEIKALEKKFEDEFKFVGKTHGELEKIVHANAQYSANEFGTIKTAIQIKQLGR